MVENKENSTIPDIKIMTSCYLGNDIYRSLLNSSLDIELIDPINSVTEEDSNES